ncbi:AAA family ATPase [Roseimaritima ulvae]|uniref:Response regulatory domain-containing protein n=1 Tax=Roseimaritima ulvae TaxID=980254 RepID=A0A5B9QNU5_9BACT|nr:hypothetical protein [Roseimaritima ulvae]QEG39619.1 hypothetical protein UC8_16150 [Roseimaritima ulvae]
MQVWIITEDDALTTRLKASLRGLGIDCPGERITAFQSAGEWTWEASDAPRVCFLAVHSIRPKHLQVLQHLRTVSQLQVVVVSQLADSETTLQIFRAGASDALIWRSDLRDQLAKLMHRLRADQTGTSRSGKMITVVPSGDLGDANLLSVNLAATIARCTGDCGLIDLHLRGGDLATMLKLAPTHTLYALLTQKQGVDESMIEQTLAAHATGIRLLASPKMFSRLNNVHASLCRPILRYLKASRPCTVVNTDDAIHAGQLRALALSDAVLVTTRLDIVSLARAKETLRFLQANHSSHIDLHVVAMRSGHISELPVKAVCKLLEITELVCIPDDPVAITASLNIGNPLVHEYPQSAFATAIQHWAEKLPVLNGLVSCERRESSRLLDQSLKFLGETMWGRRKTDCPQTVTA